MQALLAKIAARAAKADADYARWESQQPRRVRDVSAKARVRQEFYRSPEWIAARDECLAAKGRICSACGSTDQINVDHIKPRSKFPELALEQTNLRPLCWPCNRAKAARY